MGLNTSLANVSPIPDGLDILGKQRGQEGEHKVVGMKEHCEGILGNLLFLCKSHHCTIFILS